MSLYGKFRGGSSCLAEARSQKEVPRLGPEFAGVIHVECRPLQGAFCSCVGRKTTSPTSAGGAAKMVRGARNATAAFSAAT